MPNFKNMIGGTFEDLEEAVVKPVKDATGQALEQAVQTAKPLSPQQIQQKQQTQQEDQVRLAKTRQWVKNLTQDLAKARQDSEEKDKQRLESMQVEEQQSEQKELIQEQSKEEQLVQQAKQRQMAEMKAGKGVGG